MGGASAALVTGPTGFIGTQLAAELARRGRAVRALVRPASDRSGLDVPGIEAVPGDVLDPGSLRLAMAGCGQVYHLAGYARNWARDPATFRRVNVDGTRNVLDAARAAGVRRVVVTSSIVTLGTTPRGVVSDETASRSTAPLTEYEASKLDVELEAARARDGGPEVVVVNPTRVYGPGKLTEGNSMARLVDLYDRGRMPLLLDGGRPVGNYAHVGDVVAGLIAAMERGRPGERYILGGENASLLRLLDLVDEVSGRQHLRLSLPAPLARAYARVEEWRARWLGGQPLITPGWMETFLRDGAFSCSKAERELRYRITPLAEGIRQTWEWVVRRRGETS